MGLTPKRINNKEEIKNNKKCVPTAQYISPSAKPTPILFFILSYLLFNRAAINYNLNMRFIIKSGSYNAFCTVAFNRFANFFACSYAEPNIPCAIFIYINHRKGRDKHLATMIGTTKITIFL